MGRRSHLGLAQIGLNYEILELTKRKFCGHPDCGRSDEALPSVIGQLNQPGPAKAKSQPSRTRFVSSLTDRGHKQTEGTYVPILGSGGVSGSVVESIIKL
jgi:hypothetical protein